MRSRLLLVTLLTALGFAPGIAGPTHPRHSSSEAELQGRVQAQQQRIAQLRHQIRVRTGATSAPMASRGGSYQRGRRYGGYRHTSGNSRSYRKYGYKSGSTYSGKRSYSSSSYSRRASGGSYAKTSSYSGRSYSRTGYSSTPKQSYSRTGYSSKSGYSYSGKRPYGWGKYSYYRHSSGRTYSRNSSSSSSGRYRYGKQGYGWNTYSYHRRAPERTYGGTTRPPAKTPSPAPRSPVVATLPVTRPVAPRRAPPIDRSAPSTERPPVSTPPAAAHRLALADASVEGRATAPTMTARSAQLPVAATRAAGPVRLGPPPAPVSAVTTRAPRKAPEPLPASDRSVALVSYAFLALGTLFGVYTLRHYYFTINRLFGVQRHPFIDVDTAAWPTVSVSIDGRSDAAGCARTLGALLEAQYPAEKLHLRVVPPATGPGRETLEEYVRYFPGRLTLCDRAAELPCGTAALSASEVDEAEILLYFAAGCVPGKALIKQLVAPFFDPEVGAVMGRPVTANVGSSLLTRLLDLELSGGYQVDQQASMNWDQVVRLGGPVGGMRRSALESIGGWRDDASGDVDIACRLLLKGWKTVYENRAECYENVPENWAAQSRRVTGCAWQYHRALLRHGLSLLTSRQLSWGERWEGLLQLGSYATSLLLIVGWLFALGLLYLGANPFHAILALLLATWLGGLGSTPTPFGIAAAAHLDGHRRRLRLLPLHLFYALVSLVAVAGAAVCRPRRVETAPSVETADAGLLPQEFVL